MKPENSRPYIQLGILEGNTYNDDHGTLDTRKTGIICPYPDQGCINQTKKETPYSIGKSILFLGNSKTSSNNSLCPLAFRNDRDTQTAIRALQDELLVATGS